MKNDFVEQLIYKTFDEISVPEKQKFVDQMMLCIPGFTLSYQKLINHFNVELSSLSVIPLNDQLNSLFKGTL